MITFIVGIFLLLIGGIFYGKFVQKIFRPDDRPTPAVKQKDGVDFVPMSKWRNALINLLNIAGTGPIFGPIQGILFGPIAFITIPIGCVISGATHDYLCGMISMRQNGAQMPIIVRKFLGSKVFLAFNIFLCVLLMLLAAVFTYTPGDLFAGEVLQMEGINVWTWVIYGVILAYYLVATIFPIDKIIGKIYPILGGILVLSSVLILGGIFVKGYTLNELSFSDGLQGIFGLYPMWNAAGNTGAGTPFIPAFFVTVACGITSGFHSSQCALVSRTVKTEKDGSLFYWTMIAEGAIAMIWAAAAMGIYNAGSTSGTTGMVGDIAVGILGPIGSLIALFGVIVLPITSGDTALRSCRLVIAEHLKIDQKKTKNRILLTAAIMIPVVVLLVFAKRNAEGFNLLWRYSAWANQTIVVFTFGAASVYLIAKKGAPRLAFLIALLPGTFYMFITSSFILSQQIGFRLPITISYIIAAVLSTAYFTAILLIGKKYAKTRRED